MPRRYWVDLTPTDIDRSADLLELVPAAGYPIRIVSIVLGQVSDPGDSEILCLVLVRGHSVLGSGSQSVQVTPTPNASHGEAARFRANAFNTTPASGGTAVNGPRIPFNIVTGVDRPYLLEESFECQSTDGSLVLRIIDAVAGTAPADSLTIFGSVLVEEGP